MKRIFAFSYLALGLILALFLYATPVFAQAASARTPQTVTVGVYVNQIPELDVKTNSFLADFYLWFRWEGALDPTHTFEFMNAIDRNSLWKEAGYKDAAGVDKPERLAHGLQYQVYHVQGRFAQPYVLADYPLDHQTMTLGIEDKLYDINNLRYLADDVDSKLNPAVNVPGWILQGFVARTMESNYITNFGDPDTPAASAHRYSRVSFVMHVDRPINSVMAKTVLPLIVILLISFSALLLKSTNLDKRITLTVTALVSAVALHYSDLRELPPTGYLMLLDKIYILSYLLILLVIISSISSFRLADAGRDAKAMRLDRVTLFTLFVVAIAGFCLLVLWR